MCSDYNNMTDISDALSNPIEYIAYAPPYNKNIILNKDELNKIKQYEKIKVIDNPLTRLNFISIKTGHHGGYCLVPGRDYVIEYITGELITVVGIPGQWGYDWFEKPNMKK